MQSVFCSLEETASRLTGPKSSNKENESFQLPISWNQGIGAKTIDNDERLV